jgi:hypothetical protein
LYFKKVNPGNAEMAACRPGSQPARRAIRVRLHRRTIGAKLALPLKMRENA